MDAFYGFELVSCGLVLSDYVGMCVCTSTYMCEVYACVCVEGVWRRRHDMNNRVPHLFQHMLTGSIDTFPVVVSRPTHKHIAKYLYNGKYGKHILKVRLYVCMSNNRRCMCVHVHVCACVCTHVCLTVTDSNDV